MNELHVPLDPARFPCQSDQHNRKIVTLVGSTGKALHAFRDAELMLCCAGFAVFSIGCNTKSDDALTQASLLTTSKQTLDALHHDKLRLSHVCYALNVIVDGHDYVGASMGQEIALARLYGLDIWWLNRHVCSNTCSCKQDVSAISSTRLHYNKLPYHQYEMQQNLTHFNEEP